MKKHLNILFIIFIASVSQAANTISSKEVPFHHGENIVACGVLKEASRFNKGVYLNMDAAYPNQSMTFVVWEGDLAEFNKKFGNLNELVEENICGSGVVKEYKGRSQIHLYNAFSLRIEGDVEQ
ncbi:hypothetical protein [Alteromonas lipolytica]|uniref:hypothetical protein n=1 Tax=Alteromonas lipolytica TaxID=1856405 RepID=UPI0019C3ADA3|nr:hypothetical protein [Alteromonas lipolytica]GGF84228.1 hypothetical protein GCM10011338_40660 [Alteromonas lipolytica]